MDGSAGSVFIYRRVLAPRFMGELKGDGTGSVLVGRFEYTREVRWARPIGSVFILATGIYQLAPLFTLPGAIVVMGALAMLAVPIGRSMAEAERAGTLQWIRNVSRSRSPR